MASYSFHHLNRGNLLWVEYVECSGDESALELAREIAGMEEIEVRQNGQYVGRTRRNGLQLLWEWL